MAFGGWNKIGVLLAAQAHAIAAAYGVGEALAAEGVPTESVRVQRARPEGLAVGSRDGGDCRDPARRSASRRASAARPGGRCARRWAEQRGRVPEELDRLDSTTSGSGTGDIDALDERLRAAALDRPHVVDEEHGERRGQADRARRRGSSRACRSARQTGPTIATPSGIKHERAERVVRVDPRELLLRDLLLHRRVPHDPERLHADPGERRQERSARRPGAGRPGPSGNGIVSRKPSVAASRSRRGRRRSRSSPPTTRPERLGGQDQAPGRGAAEVLLRDRRARGLPRRPSIDRVHEAELEHDHPEPRPGAELAPALARAPRRSSTPPSAASPEAGSAPRRAAASEERRGVDRDPDAGARRPPRRGLRARLRRSSSRSGRGGGSRSPAAASAAGPSAGRSRSPPGRRTPSSAR